MFILFNVKCENNNVVVNWKTAQEQNSSHFNIESSTDAVVWRVVGTIPAAGIDEDPVTSSAHSQLIPFWAEKLGKKKMHANQLSQRGGEIWCGYWGDRVTMTGQCVFYMKGEIDIAPTP